jgi:hypothetical protein
VVEVSGREIDPVGSGGEKEVPEHRELAAQMLQAAEEPLHIAQGVGLDEDSGHGK